MRLSVIGCGYLGAVHAASMAELGHEVVGVDVDVDRIRELAAGRAPIFEPGLPDLLERHVASGRLRFTDDFSQVEQAQVHFIAVGTPQSRDGGADLSYLDSAVASLLPHLAGQDDRDGTRLVVGKSTVPVGTAQRLADALAPTGTLLVWNPEFLREGLAVADTLRPDRMVYGLPADPAQARTAQTLLDDVYAPVLHGGTPRLTMDYATAELVKTSANAFLATKISFINAMARVCDAAGGDVTALAQAIGMDERIGRRFLRAGIGFGGGCLPKDIRAFQVRADELGVGDALSFLGEVDRLNETMRHGVVSTATSLLGERLPQARIAVLGAAFKPDSDDVRNSPGLDLAQSLAASAGSVVVTDPQAGPLLARRPDLPYAVASSTEEALRGADLVVLATEWSEFTSLDPVRAASLVRTPVVIDGRNALDPAAWKDAGFTYTGIGRR